MPLVQLAGSQLITVCEKWDSRGFGAGGGFSSGTFFADGTALSFWDDRQGAVDGRALDTGLAAHHLAHVAHADQTPVCWVLKGLQIAVNHAVERTVTLAWWHYQDNQTKHPT